MANTKKSGNSGATKNDGNSVLTAGNALGRISKSYNVLLKTSADHWYAFAVMIKESVDLGVKQTDIAKKLGKHRCWVSRILKALKDEGKPTNRESRQRFMDIVHGKNQVKKTEETPAAESEESTESDAGSGTKADRQDLTQSEVLEHAKLWASRAVRKGMKPSDVMSAIKKHLDGSAESKKSTKSAPKQTAPTNATNAPTSPNRIKPGQRAASRKAA